MQLTSWALAHGHQHGYILSPLSPGQGAATLQWRCGPWFWWWLAEWIAGQIVSRLKVMPQRLGGLAPKLKPEPKRADRFYCSAEWLGLMRRIKAQRGNWCEDCGAGGRGVRIIGDHVIELKDGGAALEATNIRLRCLPCHNRKTAAERARRASAIVR